MNTAVETRAAAQPLALVEALAHELRQPLSAIESTAYYLTMVLPRGDKRAREHASHLRRLIEQANWILACALQLADTSPLAPERIDLGELIAQTMGAEGASPFAEGGHSPRLDLAAGLPPVLLDPGRARCLVENLLGMMGRAADAEHPVQVRTSRGAGEGMGSERGVALELAVEFSIQARSHGAEGCFGAGAALGIESARRIVEAAGGSFQIDFDDPGNVRVRILFPECVVLP